MLTLDHIAVLGETLEEAVGQVEAAVGLAMEPGGKHAHFATHNRLLGLGDGVYIEAIAADPAAPPPPYARWFGLDGFRGAARLDKWICRVEDMTAALKVLPMAGHPVTLSRGTLSWTMAVPEDGMLPFDGLFPALIQWHSPVPPGNALSSAGLSLDTLTVRHPEAAALERMVGGLLGGAQVRFQAAEVPGLEAHLNSAGATRVLR